MRRKKLEKDKLMWERKETKEKRRKDKSEAKISESKARGNNEREE